MEDYVGSKDGGVEGIVKAFQETSSYVSYRSFMSFLSVHRGHAALRDRVSSLQLAQGTPLGRSH